MEVNSKYVRAGQSFHPSFYGVYPELIIDGVASVSPIAVSDGYGCAEVKLTLETADPNHQGYSLFVSGNDDYGFVRRFPIGAVDLALNIFNAVPSGVDEAWLIKRDFELW